MINSLRLALNDLGVEVYDNSIRQGWWEGSDRSRSPAEIRTRLAAIALMGSKLGEAVGGICKPGPDHHCPEFTSETVELADCLIRIVDYCRHYGLPLAAAIEAKVLDNSKRPIKHGKEY